MGLHIFISSIQSIETCPLAVCRNYSEVLQAFLCLMRLGSKEGSSKACLNVKFTLVLAATKLFLRENAGSSQLAVSIKRMQIVWRVLGTR